MSTHTTTSSSTTTTTREESTDSDHDSDDQDHADEAPRSDAIDRDVPLSAGWQTVYNAMGVDTEGER